MRFQSSSNSNDPTAAVVDDVKMRELALRCLVKILLGLVNYYEELTGAKNGEHVNVVTSRSNNDAELDTGSESNLDLVQQFANIKAQKSIIESGMDLYVSLFSTILTVCVLL